MYNCVCFTGFISVGTVSSPTTTLVVDTLFGNREFAQSWMSKMLAGKRVLKVFLGIHDEIFRLRKEWKVFPNGVLDLHSMFKIWKESNMADVYTQCKPAVQKQLLSRGRTATNEACEEFLQQLQTPTLDFFLATLFADEGIPKNDLAKLADFRRRPISMDLVKHVALENFMKLKIFYHIYSKV